MSLPVIITRTPPGARDTAVRLASLGFRPILSPMLRLVETGLPADDLTGVHHLVFTSANGVRFARQHPATNTLTAWCVGPSTAAAAREAGFAAVFEGGGGGADLARLILAACPTGPLLHIANDAAAGELVAALKAGGLDARFSAAYRTEPVAALSEEALAALAGPRPAILLVHSAKAAAASAAAPMPDPPSAIVAISCTALAPLKGRAAHGEWVAARPNDESLLDAVQAAASALAG